MRGYRIALLSGVALLLGACAGPVILGINIGTLSTIGSIASTAATGKGLGEHAVSAIADEDCRFIEPLFRDDRKFCEPEDSPARKDDFNGLVDLFDKGNEAPTTMVAAAEPGVDGAVEAPPAAIAVDRGIEIAPLAAPVSAEPAIAEAPIVLAKPPAPVRLAAAPPAPRPKPAAEPVTAAGGRYTVRVGSYANARFAAAFARKLRSEGYQVQVSQMRGEGPRFWSVVHITGFGDAATAERAARTIARENDTRPGLVLTQA
jgi:hypothetical protein